MRKRNRQQLILDLIQNNDIENQEQLTDILKSKGIYTSQATISRDLRKLRISKIQGDNYEYKYGIVGGAPDPLTEKVEKISKEAILSIEKSAQLIVVKTIPYCATVCGQHITNTKLENIGGVVTGIDTIFITPKSLDSIDSLLKDVKALIL